MKSAIEIKPSDNCFSLFEKEYGFSRCFREGITYMEVPRDLGNGYLSVYTPCKDVTISVKKLRLDYPLVMRYEDFDCEYQAAYCFSGSIIHSEPGGYQAQLGKGEHAVFLKENSEGIMMLPSEQNIYTLTIRAKGLYKHIFPYQGRLAFGASSDFRSLTNALMRPTKTSVQIQNLYRQIVECDMDLRLYPMFCENVSKTILATLWQNEVLDVIENKGGCYLTQYEKKAIRNAKSIIEDKYTAPPTVDVLAREVGVSEYNLRNGFREMYGKTTYEFVRELRMNNAICLLEDEDLSISQIAYHVGYVNTSHFARAFRNRFGKNPRDFRRGV